jgi:hypothetical protein
MSNKYKLLYGNATEETYKSLDVVTEQSNKDQPKAMYLEGVYGEAGKLNKNGRVYDFDDALKDIDRYNNEIIKSNRAYNELNHPSTPDIDLERACDRTVSLRMESDGTIIGRSLVMDTPMGRIQKALIESGGSVGKSSRAMGQIAEKNHRGDACNYVNGVHYVCFDSVQDPSVGRALPDALLEQREWIIGENGGFLAQPLDDFRSSLDNIPKVKRDMYIAEQYIKFINAIGRV